MYLYGKTLGVHGGHTRSFICKMKGTEMLGSYDRLGRQSSNRTKYKHWPSALPAAKRRGKACYAQPQHPNLVIHSFLPSSDSYCSGRPMHHPGSGARKQEKQASSPTLRLREACEEGLLNGIFKLLLALPTWTSSSSILLHSLWGESTQPNCLLLTTLILGSSSKFLLQ